jgi:DNA-directed RNA polymerase specialized sigma24 family protein
MGEGHSDFATWYSTAHPKVVTSLMLVTGDLHAAQEAADEAFARAYDRWSRVSNMDSPTGWTYRVAHNVLRRKWHRAALERTLLLRRPAPTTIPAPAGETWEAVRRLPERQRAAVVLHYVADLTEVEVAATMGISRSTVSSSLTAAKRRLGRMLADDPPSAKEAEDV